MFTNRFLLYGLYFIAMGRAFRRLKDPRRKASGRHQAAFYKKAWREAAESLGGQCVPLGERFSEITVDGNRTRVVDSYSAIDDPVTLALMHDKPLTHQILNAVGLATPRHAVFSLKQMAPAVEFLKTSPRHCVIKPAGGTGGGRGVTTGIRTPWHLANAAAAAACYADELLIEEQLEGDNYRLLYLEGELIDAFVRRPPGVVGDGQSSVAQLVRRANDDRLSSGSQLSQVLIAVDLDMKRTLARQGLTLASVPPPGTAVTLKTVINENCGADNSTATDALCDSIIEDGRKAVAALGARFAGIDIITTNPALPLSQSGGAIIEVNGTPNLYYHYHKKDSSFPVAIPLLRRLLVERNTVARP